MKRKKSIFATVLFLSLFIIQKSNFAQDTVKANTIYTGIINIVEEDFKFPMIGIVNIANGNFDCVQLGFYNFIKGNHQGAQIGFVNTTLGKIEGAQLGYINYCHSDIKGIQAGFVNANNGKLEGAALGFVNISNDSIDGGQFGFVNISNKSTDGINAGFVNLNGEDFDGAQFGFVNINANKMDGAQFGFINISKKLKGFQLGFVNIVDSLEEGIPIGFLSIVGKNGYQALGVYTDEFNPFNAALRIGVKNLYTSFTVSYNHLEEKNNLNFGLGMGSIINFNEKLFFNPEIISLSNSGSWGKEYKTFTSLNLAMGYNFTPRLHFSFGPSITHSHSNTENEFFEPYFNTLSHQIDKRNQINLGFRTGLYFSLSK